MSKSPKDKSKVDEQEHYDWYTEQRKRIEANMDRFEELKRKVDSDPFGVLFGRRLAELYPRKWRSFSNQETAKSEGEGSKPTTSTGEGGAAKLSKNMNDASKNQTETEYSHSSTNGWVSSAFAGLSGTRKPIDQGYDIDPITMRKVPKEAISSTSTRMKNRDTQDESVDIPVKRFVTTASKTQDRDTTKPLKDHFSESTSSGKPLPPRVNTIPNSQADGNIQDWLAREGFGAKGQTPGVAAAGLKKELQMDNIETRSSPLKIESALERHLRTKGSSSEREPHTRSNLQYDAKENKTDDVDLLRPSDVRAASGLRGRTPKETAEERQERRSSLAADYENRVQGLERQFVEEITAHNANGSDGNDATDKSNMSTQSFNDKFSALRSGSNAALNAPDVRSTKDARPQGTHTAQDLGAQPAVATWPEPGEGDMASNVHEFAGRGRWYKQKAPHAREQSEAKFMQADNGRALLREIRSIYEDTYGIIDTKHRQKSHTLSVENQVERAGQPGVNDEEQPPSEDGRSRLEEHELSSKHKNKQTPGDYSPPNLEGMAMIQRLFEELHETQILIQAHQLQLEGIPTKGESSNLLQSLRASEQRVLQTLKTAWTLLKTSAALPSQRTERSSDNSSTSATETSSSPPTGQQASSNVYRILAYDPYTQKVTTAKTTSLKGSPNEKPLTLSEALSTLTNPAKFVPHFASLNKLGYEIISGGANILVFKQVRPERPSAISVDDSFTVPEATVRHANPIDGTTTQTGNFASPTGFVNHDAVLPPSELERQELPDLGQVTSGEKVRREEPVFSGSSRTRWQDQYDPSPREKAKLKSKLRRAARRKRTLRRMVWVGVWTATCCYFVGLATEHLRV